MLIVESVALYRAGLAALSAQIPGLEIVAALDECVDVLALLARLDPQLVLVGTSVLGFAVELIRRIKRTHPHMRVLAISGCGPQTSVVYGLRAGADGYVLDGATREEFRAAIACALRGEHCSGPNMAVNAPRRGWKLRAATHAMKASDRLTLREHEVLVLAASGNSNKSMANCLGLSVNTVEKHRARLMKKLDLHNVTALTRYAITRGWIAASRSAREAPEFAAPGAVSAAEDLTIFFKATSH